MELRNAIFAHVYDWLCRERGVRDQLDLAEKTKISKNTISNILKGNTSVSDHTLRKLNEGFGNIFNMQYLRGIDPYHMTVQDLMEDSTSNAAPFVAQKYQEMPSPPKSETVHKKDNASLESGVEHLLTLAGQIIKENENLRRELKEQLAEVQSIIRELKSMMPTKYSPSQPGQSLLAAEE